jgi:2-polyprenyl-3-methyl-5-hydroxy-6-metoxy-1,4-benzoquinol methylase
MESVKNKYKEYLNTKNGAANYNEFKKILYSSNDTLVNEIQKNIIADTLAKKELSICDLGGGDGRRLIQIVEHLRRKGFANINMDLIEQSKVFTDSFRELSSQIKHYTQVNIFTQLIEEFIPTKKYDIILLLHSIFCLSDSNVFDQIKKSCKADGEIIIASNAANSFLSVLKSKIDNNYSDKRYEIDDLRTDLKERKINFSNYAFKTKWNIKAKEVKKKAGIVLQWLSLGRFEKMSQKDKNELIEFTLSLANKKDNVYYFSENEEVIKISNSL